MPSKHEKSLYVVLPSGETKRIRFCSKTEAEAKKGAIRPKSSMIWARSRSIQRPHSRSGKRNGWKRTSAQNVTDSTFTEIEQAIDRVYTPTLGQMKMGDIRLIHVQKCLQHISGQKQIAYSPGHNAHQEPFPQGV